MRSRSIPSAWAMRISASRRGVSLIAAIRRAAAASASRTFIEAREALGLVLGGQGADQLVEIAFEDFGKAMQSQVDAMIGDPPLRKIIGADPLGAIARS